MSTIHFPQFSEFSVNDLFAESAAEEDIPTISWPFTEALLNHSTISSTVPSSSSARHATASAHASSSIQQPRTTAESSSNNRQTPFSASTAQSTGPTLLPVAPHIDLNELFRSAALESSMGASSSAALRPSGPSTIPHQAEAHQQHAPTVSKASNNDLFFFDTEGNTDAPSHDHHPSTRSQSMPHSDHVNNTTSTTYTLNHNDVAAGHGGDLFFVDTEGDQGQPLISGTTDTVMMSVHSETVATLETSLVSETPEAAHPNIPTDAPAFVIDTEGDSSVAPQKIRYRVHKLDVEARALGDHISSSSEDSTEHNDDDDGDDEVVYRPPGLGARLAPSRIEPDISFATIDFLIPPPDPNEASTSGGKGPTTKLPTALSKQAHDGYAKKLKKRAKMKRRKERQRNERKAELSGLRDEAFDQAAATEDAAPRVGDSDLEWGSDGPPSAAPVAKPSHRSKTRRRGKGKGKAQPANIAGRSPVVDDDHGMDIDSDLALEDAQYERMLAKMLAPTNHVTIDDIADEAKLRAEDDDDEGSEDRGSSAEDDSEDEVTLEIASNLQLDIDDDGESLSGSEEEDDNDDNSSSEDEDEDLSFQTKLGRMRARANNGGTKGQAAKPSLNLDSDDEDDFDELFGGAQTWADADEDAIQDIEVRSSSRDRLYHYTFLLINWYTTSMRVGTCEPCYGCAESQRTQSDFPRDPERQL